jgi:hypothetical protein
MDGPHSATTSPRVDPTGVALGLEGKRGTVRVLTKMGSEYTFPDMVVSELKRVLPEGGRIKEDMPSLMMMNASMAVLTIPFRIIKEIEVDKGEVLWACPV